MNDNYVLATGNFTSETLLYNRNVQGCIYAKFNFTKLSLNRVINVLAFRTADLTF